MTELNEAIILVNKAVNANITDPNTLNQTERDKLSAMAMNIHVFIRPRIVIIGQEEIIARIRMKAEKQFDEIMDYVNKQIEHKFRPNREFEIQLPDVDIHWAGDEALQTRVLGEIGKMWMIRKTDWLHAELTLRQLKLDSPIFDPRKL